MRPSRVSKSLVLGFGMASSMTVSVSAQPSTNTSSPSTQQPLLTSQVLPARSVPDSSSIAQAAERSLEYIELRYLVLLGDRSTACAIQALEECSTRAEGAAAVWEAGASDAVAILREKQRVGLAIAAGGAAQSAKGLGAISRAGLSATPFRYAKSLDSLADAAELATDPKVASAAAFSAGILEVFNQRSVAKSVGILAAASGAQEAIQEHDILASAGAAASATGTLFESTGAAAVGTAVMGAKDVRDGVGHVIEGLSVVVDTSSFDSQVELFTGRARERTTAAKMYANLAADLQTGSSPQVRARLQSLTASHPELAATGDAVAQLAASRAARVIEECLDRVFPKRDLTKGWSGCASEPPSVEATKDRVKEALARAKAGAQRQWDELDKETKESRARMAGAAADVQRFTTEARAAALQSEQRMVSDLLKMVTEVGVASVTDGAGLQAGGNSSPAEAYDVEFLHPTNGWTIIRGVDRAEAESIVAYGKSVTRADMVSRNRIVRGPY